MPNARWWRDAALVFLALGAVSGAAFIVTSPTDGHFSWREAALLLSATSGIWALLSLPFVQRTYRSDARLRGGEGVLARWTLTPAEWDRFVTAERNRSGRTGAPTNLVSADRRVPPGGLEVIIGVDAIIVGDEYHRLHALGRLGPGGPSWVSTPVPVLEYHLVDTDSTDAFVDRVIRVPVAPSSVTAARALAKG